mgnify:CR=1 FL=1
MKGIPAILLLVLVLSSCSWLSARRLNNTDDGETTVVQDMVPKAQYDQLLGKYNELLRNSQNQKYADAQVSTPVPTKEEFIDVVDDLNKAKPTPGKVENSNDNTIDVFAKQKSDEPQKAEAKAMAPVDDDSYAGEDSIENQIASLRKARELLSQNQHNAATNILKELDKSSVKQIKVQAKFLIAEMFFAQKEYDLAMQIYEEIITKYAFSGTVLKALGRVVVCTERLKLAKKQEQYYSLLHEIFEGT